MKQTPEPKQGTTPPRKARAGPRLVHLEFFDPNACAVFVAGSFNDWHPDVTEMLRTPHGRWVKELTLPPGDHEYRLVVDGAWTTDPSCPRRVTNPFGTENSVLTVAP